MIRRTTSMITRLMVNAIESDELGPSRAISVKASVEIFLKYTINNNVIGAALSAQSVKSFSSQFKLCTVLCSLTAVTCCASAVGIYI